MTREIALFIVGLVIGVGIGLHQGSSWVQSKWNKEKLSHQHRIIEYQQEIKKLEIEHAKRERDIISTFNEVKKDYENTVNSITSAHIDSLREHEERADTYRQKYQHCSSLVERTVRLDKALSEGVGLVEELEAVIKLKDSGIIARDHIIENDRLLINQ